MSDRCQGETLCHDAEQDREAGREIKQIEAEATPPPIPAVHVYCQD